MQASTGGCNLASEIAGRAQDQRGDRGIGETGERDGKGERDPNEDNRGEQIEDTCHERQRDENSELRARRTATIREDARTAGDVS